MNLYRFVAANNILPSILQRNREKNKKRYETYAKAQAENQNRRSMPELCKLITRSLIKTIAKLTKANLQKFTKTSNLKRSQRVVASIRSYKSSKIHPRFNEIGSANVTKSHHPLLASEFSSVYNSHLKTNIQYNPITKTLKVVNDSKRSDKNLSKTVEK